ncbi:magnesium and cobalt transport protein CorA [Luteipulveratus flavus]|uniref:Magnesium and cobalt transport protein CorA n=1 Tax=Luteipulveratus flavus TaxID=3031728 RepID=A0ABT6CAH0_9MICO|nr:magnesium and cobalt transport protein CorA [Luteipulveratus sp. YIM 133296]MDF8265895.1 magnesium and cobalt transport protein CorA [Luteipulveratus sp. YIM 133296]
MIVDQAVYRDGKRLPCGDLSDELDELRADSTGFLWIGLKDPTAEEFDLVKDELGLHPLAVEDAVTGNQRPKIERYEGGNVFVAMKTLSYIEATSDVETGEVMLFIGERFALTVRRGEPTPLAPVRAALEHAPQLMEHGPVAVLYSVMDAVVDNYVRIDDELTDDLDQIERDVFSADRATNVQTIYSLKREVLETRRAAQPLVEPLTKLLRGEWLPTEAVPFFRDINDHLLRVVDHVESYDRLLTDVLNAHLAQVSVQQNNDMRKISAWVAIAALPTMIAGIYGMNFHYMPELEASVHVGNHEVYYGYFVVLAVIVLACVTLYRAFKRSGWL